jgi:hypothetical protein
MRRFSQTLRPHSSTGEDDASDPGNRPQRAARPQPFEARAEHASELVLGGGPAIGFPDCDSLRRAVAVSGPATVINGAAYTALDRRDLLAAAACIALGPLYLTQAAREAGARLVHVFNRLRVRRHGRSAVD